MNLNHDKGAYSQWPAQYIRRIHHTNPPLKPNKESDEAIGWKGLSWVRESQNIPVWEQKDKEVSTELYESEQ